MSGKYVSVSGTTVVVDVNPGQMIGESYQHMAKAGMIKPLLTLAGIALVLFLIDLFVRRKARESREKARARIWRKEYKNKN